MKVTPARVCDIAFERPVQKKHEDATPSRPKRKRTDITPPSEAQIDAFFKQVNMADKKPAILTVTQPYAKEFIPKLCTSTLPMPLTELYSQEALHMDYLSLLDTCESTFQSIKVTIVAKNLFLSLSLSLSLIAFFYIPHLPLDHT